MIYGALNMHKIVLIYATGRNFEKYQLAASQWDILKPDILVTQDGVSIHWFNKSLAQQVQAKSTHKIGKILTLTLTLTFHLYFPEISYIHRYVI